MTPRLLLAAMLATTAMAPARSDPRIATRTYEASSVVTLHGHAGIESTIAFAPDERIENVAVGNSAAWQVTPNKRANLLFVKPVGARAHTNMTVVTDQRTYLFDLVSSAAAAPVYMLQFSYPQPQRPVAANTTPQPPAAAETVAAASPPPAATKPAGPTPADLNFDWRGKGDRQLMPAHSFDDGQATFLQWPSDATLPAILVRAANGVEGPVNYTVRGDYIVVDGVPTQLIPRAGKQMATLTAPPRRARALSTADAAPHPGSAQP